MQHLFISCFAFLFSFGHAHTVRATEANAFVPPPQYVGGFDFPVPSHRDLVSGNYSYAGNACTGCRMTNSTSPAR